MGSANITLCVPESSQGLGSYDQFYGAASLGKSEWFRATIEGTTDIGIVQRLAGNTTKALNRGAFDPQVRFREIG